LDQHLCPAQNVEKKVVLSIILVMIDT
jgi:hypothetical protein